MKRLTSIGATFTLLFASTVMAGPLDTAKVPRDAKWVIHVDYEALSETAVMEKLREARPQIVQQVRGWLQERYGIDPREDLHGVTLFSDTYDAHTGAIVLFADYDLEKVKSDLMSKSGVKSTQWEGHTLFTWTAHKNAASYEGHADSRSDEDAADRKSNTEEARPHEEHEGGSVTAVLLDGKTAVFAPTPDRVQSVVKLLQGDAPAIEGEDSKLIADIPKGAILYGAAVELQDIAGREQLFPILQQHEHIRWVVGERDGRLFEECTLVAQNKEVASQMKTALEGFVAFGKLWAADSEELASLYDDVEIRQQGSTVRLEWEGESEEVVAALSAFGDRLAQWSGRQQRRRQ